MKETNYEAIAQRVFTSTELDSFFAVTELDRIKEFYKLWTIKESYVKYLGTGIDAIASKVINARFWHMYCFDEYSLSVCVGSAGLINL